MPFEASGVSAVIATHSHIDHIGAIPRLVRDGFSGKVFATPPTADIGQVSLMDSAHLMEEDAAYRNRKKLTRHKVARPLFSREDAVKAVELFCPTEPGCWTAIGSEFLFRFHIAGHILGAMSVEVKLNDRGRKTSILFSGDIGRYAVPLVSNPAEPPETDYLVCESTYGSDVHPPEDPFFMLASVLDDIIKHKSVLLVPAFAVGRTQQIVYMINTLIRMGRVKPIDVHIDSPMAIKATNIYRKYPDYHTIDLSAIGDDDDFLGGPNVHIHRDRASSKALNKLKGPAVIISASGMMTGGRIMHHLIHRLPDRKTTLALVGFMAQGTLGRKVDDGEKLVYVHKRPVEVRARVMKLGGLSGHADYYEIGHWLEKVENKPKQVFITHGEPDESKAMAAYLKEQKGWSCTIPVLDQTFELETDGAQADEKSHQG